MSKSLIVNGPAVTADYFKDAKDSYLGLKLRIIAHELGYFCGYVQLPNDHPWIEKSCAEMSIDVHGDITFQGMFKGLPGEWIGFDCFHAHDKRHPSFKQSYYFPGSKFRDFNYVATEVIKLAKQVHEARSAT